MTYHTGTDVFFDVGPENRTIEVRTVRWWRRSGGNSMSNIHVASDEGYHDEIGRTACGMKFDKNDTIEGPHHEMHDEDGRVDGEDRYCRTCLRAIGVDVQWGVDR